MGVRIEYTIRDGSERHFDVSAFTTEVRMGYLGIAETSLAPLSSLRRLRILTLQYNHIESIDLSPLASCKELREIYLRGNLLKSIDLNPLCTLRHLTSLYLNSNRLVELDLSPLSACHLLAKLDLSKNEIYSIDLTPLYNSPSAHVEIDKDVKATTLVSKASYEMATCKSLLDATTQFDVPTRISDYSWIGQLYSTLRKGEPLWKKYHILCEALRNLDLDWIGIPEVDIDKTLRFIKRTSNRSKASRRLRKMLVAQVCKQIDKGKSCPLLNIEEAKQEPDLVMRLQTIIDGRTREIERVVIPESKGIYDLRPLWITAYGNEILDSMKVGISCNQEDYERVTATFHDLGFDLKTSTAEKFRYSKTVSLGLQEYIWNLAEFRSPFLAS